MVNWTLRNKVKGNLNRNSFKKMHLNMSSGKCRPFSLGLNVLIEIVLNYLHTMIQISINLDLTYGQFISLISDGKLLKSHESTHSSSITRYIIWIHSSFGIYFVTYLICWHILFVVANGNIHIRSIIWNDMCICISLIACSITRPFSGTFVICSAAHTHPSVSYLFHLLEWATIRFSGLCF